MYSQSIEILNLINKSNEVKPSYNLSQKETYIELYVGKEKVCIIGSVDPNYICWCSITDIQDKQNNAKIFDHIANDKMIEFSQLYKVINFNDFFKIENWYHCRITRTSEKGMLWATPFGHYYGSENREQHGRFFSENIVGFYDDILKLCELRAGGQRYLQMLAHYLEILRKDKDYRYYYEMKPLISILEKESYLNICPDEKIRNLYRECMNMCSEIYNRYMTEVR